MTIYNATWSATVTWDSSKQNVVLFIGHKFDWKAGLYYQVCRRRYYYLTLGRWMTRDPKDQNKGLL